MFKAYRISPHLTLAAYVALQPAAAWAQEVIEDDEVIELPAAEDENLNSFLKNLD